MSGLGLREYYDGKQNEQGEVIGEVVLNDDIADPRKLGGLRIRVKGHNDDETGIPTEDLPIVMPIRQIGTGTGEGIGSFAIPSVGTQVIVKRDDTYNWVYTSEILTTNHEGAGNFQGSYPNTWGMKDRTGSMAQINMETHQAYFLHVSGSSLTVIRSGTVYGLVKDDLFMTIDDNGTWTYGGYLSQIVAEWKFEQIGLTNTLVVGVNNIIAVAAFQTTNIGAYNSLIVGGIDSTIVGADRTSTIVGGEDVTCGGSRSATVGGSDTTTIIGSEKSLIGEGQTLEVGTNRNVNIGVDEEVTINGNQTITVGVNGEIIIGGSYSVHAVGTCNIHADGFLYLNSSTGIVMNSTGPVNIVSGTVCTIAAPVVNIID